MAQEAYQGREARPVAEHFQEGLKSFHDTKDSLREASPKMALAGDIATGVGQAAVAAPALVQSGLSKVGSRIATGALEGGIAAGGSSEASPLTGSGAEWSGDVGKGAAVGAATASVFESPAYIAAKWRALKGGLARFLVKTHARGASSRKITPQILDGMDEYFGVKPPMNNVQTALRPAERLQKLEGHIASARGNATEGVQAYVDEVWAPVAAAEERALQGRTLQVEEHRKILGDMNKQLERFIKDPGNRHTTSNRFLDTPAAKAKQMQDEITAFSKMSPRQVDLPAELQHLSAPKIQVRQDYIEHLSRAKAALEPYRAYLPEVDEVMKGLDEGIASGSLDLDDLLRYKRLLNANEFTAASGKPVKMTGLEKESINQLRAGLDDVLITGAPDELKDLAPHIREYAALSKAFPSEYRQMLDVPGFTPSTGTYTSPIGTGGGTGLVTAAFSSALGPLGQAGLGAAATATSVFLRTATSKPAMWVKLSMIAAKQGNQQMAGVFQEASEVGMDQVAAKYSMLAPDMWAGIQAALPIMAGQAIADSPDLKAGLRKDIMNDKNLDTKAKMDTVQGLNDNTIFAPPKPN